MNKKFFILFLVLFLFCPQKTLSQTFTSPTYQIQWGNFNMTGGRKTSNNYILTDSVGQNAPGQFDNTGFIIKSGFQYAYEQQKPFSFNINSLDINLGTLAAGVASTQSNIITITTPSGNGYQVSAIADKPLTIVSTNITIPDTGCDSNDCDKTTSTTWTNNSKYGFGFNVIGIDSSLVATGVGTSNYFTDSTYFRPFAATSKSDNPQIIMSENQSATNHSAKITYKAVISGNQSAGNYQNSINFIAIPKY